MKDIIVIPTYNERNNIRLLIDEIFRILPDVHVLVVDDNSPDQTALVVREQMKRYANLSILERQKKTGLGDAYKHALSTIKRDPSVRAVVTMDADGSHDSGHLPELLAALDGSDLVVGSRYISGGGIERWEYWRKSLSRWGNIYARLLTGVPISDMTAGFVCVRKSVLEKLDLSSIASAGYAYQIEFKYHCFKKASARVKELPILFKSRREGESKLSNQIVYEGIKTPLKLFFQRLW